MKKLNRRQVVQGLSASALSPWLAGNSYAQSSDIVIGAAQPITGVFAFAGVSAISKLFFFFGGTKLTPNFLLQFQ
jgi:hypothetical protein